MDWFVEYLEGELNARNVDCEVYGQYICGLLQDDTDVSAVEDILCELQLTNPKEFAHQLQLVYKRGYALPSEVSAPEIVAIHQPTENAVQENSGDVKAAPEEVLVDISTNLECTLDAEDELLSLEEPPDWLRLIEDVEHSLTQIGCNSYSTGSIYQALSKSDLDVQRAIVVLQQTSEALNKCKPCRHMLAGHCARSDCWFDHNLSDVPCRYWLYDRCSQEQVHFNPDSSNDVIISYGSCPFLHDCIWVDARPEPKQSMLQSFTDEQFPSLPSSAVPTSSSRVRHTDSPAASLFSFTYARRTPSVSGTASLGTDKAATSGWSKYDLSASNSSSGSHGDLKHTTSSSRGLLPTEWVESGTSVGVNYAALRAEAREFALARNKLLEEATRAFRSGNRMVAKSLSDKGQELNRQMKVCHARAAQTLFRQRNTDQSVYNGKLDLHGLHVAEALECLDALLPALQKMRVSPVKVITGSGHHTLGPQQGKSRLFPAVQSYCEEMGLKISVIKDDNGYPGGMSVYL